MPLPTLRRKQVNLAIKEEETLAPGKHSNFKNIDPDQRTPKNTFGIVDSPLNDSLLMLVDLAQDIQVGNGM